jgi:hypothetical protein
MTTDPSVRFSIAQHLLFDWPSSPNFATRRRGSQLYHVGGPFTVVHKITGLHEITGQGVEVAMTQFDT